LPKAHFERALNVARAQQAKSPESRTAIDMASLFGGQSKVQQAREPSAPLYGWFTEGLDTRHLKEAKALLKEWAAWPFNGLLGAPDRAAHRADRLNRSLLAGARHYKRRA
jgi:hypothetical protein